MQTMEIAPGAKKPGILTVLRTSIEDSGIRSVYTGLTASWLRQMSYSLVRLGTYEEIKSRLSRNGPPSTFSLIAAASFAGGLGGIVGNPAGA
jgi:dicarboxylate transporter 10